MFPVMGSKGFLTYTAPLQQVAAQKRGLKCLQQGNPGLHDDTSFQRRGASRVVSNARVSWHMPCCPG